MEISIQTDRPQKRLSENHSQLITPRATRIVDPEQQQQKERYIKKLTIKNRDLLEQLKDQNEELSKRIGKQKMKPKSYQKEPVTKSKGLESVKRELANAYKQIDMYKMLLVNLRAKDISSEAHQKLNGIQNKIKVADNQIEQLQRELKVLGGIKNQQEKEIQVFENPQTKRIISQLQKQANTLKQKIKVYRKTAAKRQQAYKKQQAYQLELQKLLREYNEEYYPGKQEKKQKKEEKKYNPEDVVDVSNISYKQWEAMKAQLKEVRLQHNDYLKKIQNLNRMKLKQVKSQEENELKLKQKEKVLKNLRTKLNELKKLVIIRKSVKQGDSLISQAEKDNEDAGIEQDLMKVNSSLLSNDKNNLDNQRQFKKWIIPETQIQEKGKIFPNSIFFSDKKLLSDTSKRVRIIEVTIWTNIEDDPCLIKATYLNDNDDEIEGKLPNVELAGLNLRENTFEMSGGDYLIRIDGMVNDSGNIVYLLLTSRFGKTMEFGQKISNGTQFVFAGRNDQVPSCLYGAYLPRQSLGFSICHLGCELSKNW